MAGKAQNNDYVADAIDFNASGWIEDAEEHTWDFASADGKTFVVNVDADLTGVISVGMRWRCRQGTLQYAIVTAVGAYSSGYTQITLYAGTDYAIVDAAIEDVGYSSQKAPFGFPLSPSKWTVESVDETDRTSTTFGSVVQVNAAHVINLPIGAWYVSYQAYVGWSGVTSNMNVSLALSTSTSSISSKAYQRSFQTVAAGATTPVALNIEMNPMLIEVSTKTPYYLVGVFGATGTNWQLQGSTYAPTYIRAVCAYL